MNAMKTDQVLAAMTDEGLFERLATAILREADPLCRSLGHPGVNAAGKTVKSPVDGFCFVPGADPPHMILVHHTITRRVELEKKWLHDPSKVTPRKGPRPSAPAGDLIKTAEVVAGARTHTPDLRATLILTTNEEPSVDLVRAVKAAGRDHGLEIDLWGRSRLSHFLDNQPTGQWIRRSYLGIEQEQLSAELLYELSKKSLEVFRPPDNPAAWVPRTLDEALSTGLRRDVTFLVAGSGMGKSVACFRMLETHVDHGGVGLILSHEVVASAMTLEQAVTTMLCRLHPPLAAVSASPLSFCSPERPLLLVVEDINSSGQPQHLAEKLLGWNRASAQGEKGPLSSWRMICPLWPEILASMGEQVRKRFEPLILTAGGFSASEGRDAVLARARMDGRELSSLSAEEISHSLGQDPLLIALHDQNTSPAPHLIIGQFVEGSLSRAAALAKEGPAADYRQALRALAGQMLANRRIELKWLECKSWPGLQGEPLRLLGILGHHGELIRFTGPSGDQQLSFRHDRVRDWLLADAAAELDRCGNLPEQVVAEPYFAEVMGAVIVSGNPSPFFLERTARLNPLALFSALRFLGQSSVPLHRAVLRVINNWLDNPGTHSPANLHLRWEALAMLAQTDSPAVISLVRKFRDRGLNGALALLRNGDLSGGIALCSNIEPGIGAPWRDAQIEHAKLHHGPQLARDLDALLRQTELDSAKRTGALRLAGHLADPGLAVAIEASWIADDERDAHLDDYLWAFAECCEDDPARFLSPVCDAWAALPETSEKEEIRPLRSELATDHVRWAFRKWPPRAAIDYFVSRGSQEDLRWPITFMLHGMDHPKAVLFVVQELAAIERRLESTKSFSPFLLNSGNDWRRAQEDGRPMSRPSRDLLLELWRDENNDKYLRSQSFLLWAATQEAADIKVLRSAKPSEELGDRIFQERLTRGDQRAIPEMIEKLDAYGNGFWWQYGKYVWSPQLTDFLDKSLEKPSVQARREWGESVGLDHFASEMIMRLPERDAEWLLEKHWAHLRWSPHFVQAALYVSTPRLVEAAHAALRGCPEPAKLLEHLSYRFGIHIKDHPGITREAQIHSIAPFLHLLSSIDISRLWEECNVHGWFVMRRELLDDLLQPPFPRGKWNCTQSVVELDKMVAEKRLVWLDHWIDDFLKAGVLWSEILVTMRGWLDARRSFEALQVVAAAVEHSGSREDLVVLVSSAGMPEAEAVQLIADTEFAVRRRRIS